MSISREIPIKIPSVFYRGIRTGIARVIKRGGIPRPSGVGQQNGGEKLPRILIDIKLVVWDDDCIIALFI